MAATATLIGNSPHSLIIHVAYDAGLTGVSKTTAELRAACSPGPLRNFLTAHATDLTDLYYNAGTPNSRKIRIYAITGDATASDITLPGGISFTATGITVKDLAVSVYGTAGVASFELRLLHSTTR